MLSVAAADVVFVFLLPATQSYTAITSCPTPFVSSVSIWDIFSTIWLFLTEGEKEKKKNRRCAFRREGEQKKSSGYVLLKSRLACCNVCFLKWSRFWGNWLYKSLGGNLWRVKIQGHMLSSSPPASLCSATHPVFFFWEGGRESDWEGKEGGRKKKKSLLTHKLVNAVALSTFSSNENFRHLHINLISCVSLSSLPLLH